MPQLFSPPTDADIDRIARQFLTAEALVRKMTGQGLQSTRADLGLLQAVLDKSPPTDLTSANLQALGIAFGKALLSELDGFDWWMVSDEYGCDPTLRYKETSLLLFPQTLLSKRYERGETVDLQDFFDGLLGELRTILSRDFNEQ